MTTYSIRTYTGTGSLQVLPTPPYIDAAHISVTANGLPVPFTFATAGTVNVTAPAASAVVVRRNTPAVDPLVVFQMPVSADALNLSARQLLYIAQEAYDNVQPFTSIAGFATGLLSSLGSTLVGHIASGIGAVGRTLAAKLGDSTSVLDYGADPTGATDSSLAFQRAVNAALRVEVPPGSFRLNSSVNLRSGSQIIGVGPSSTINAYGVDAFVVPAGVSFVGVRGLGIFSYTAAGIPDPRLYAAVFCNGTDASNINYVKLRDLYLQGWSDGINWLYTWNSTIQDCSTVNGTYGLVLRGRSVNNTVSGCSFVTNGGTAGIYCTTSGGATGEGLMVSNTLIASGLYGLLVDGSFLSLHLSNSIVDLITGDAVRATDCRDLRVANSWLYAANSCVRLQALGTPAPQGSIISGCGLRITSSTGRVIEQNSANQGLAVTGNRFTFGGTSVGLYLNGESASVANNYFENSGSAASIAVNSGASTHRIGLNTGVDTVSGAFAAPQYSEGVFTVTDQSGAGLAITNNTQAHWTRVGKMVTVVMDIRFPVTANGSLARLSLPFQAAASLAPPSGVLGYQDINGVFLPGASTTAANFVFWKPGATGTYATNVDVSGARFQVTFTYRTV